MSETLGELELLIVQHKADLLRMRRLQDRITTLARALPTEFDKLANIVEVERSEVSDFPKLLRDHLEARLAVLEASAMAAKTDGERCLDQIADIDLRAFAESADATAQSVLERIETDVFPALASLVDSALGESVSRLEQRARDLAGEWQTSWETTETVIADAQTELSDMKQRLEDAFTEFTDVDVDEALTEAAQNMLGTFGETVSGITQRIEALKSDIAAMVDRLNTIMEIFRRAREAKDMAQSSAGTGLELVVEILDDLTDTLKSV